MKIKALKSFTTADLNLSLANGWVRDVDDTLGAQLIAGGYAESYEITHPEGEISITQNGTVDVAQYATAAVNVGAYKIIYDVNGGTGAIAPEAVGAGSTVVLNNGNTITPPTNKAFIGWATTSDATEPDVTSPYRPTEDITLYAVYEVVSYTISYDANGGTGTVAAQTVSVGQSTNLSDGTGLTAPTGKEFVGWATTSDAEIPDVTSPYTPEADITLYAVYSVIVYTVTYNVNGGTGTISPVNVNAGESISLNDGTGITAPANMAFQGWATTAEATQPNVTSPYTPAASITLYAVYTVSEYEITFDLQGGSGVIPMETVAPGGSITLPAQSAVTPPSEGEWLEGWGEAPYSAIYNPGGTYTPTGNTPEITIYAVWGS